MSTIKLTGSASGNAQVTVAAAAGTPTITLPTASIDFSTAGSDGQFLKTNGSGTLSFATVSTGADLTPAFHATQSGNQTVANGTTKIALNSETFDSDSAFDHSTNYRFTVPSGEGGKYWFAYCIRLGYGLDDGETLQGELYKNGSDLAGTYSHFRSPGSSGYNPSAVNCSGIIVLEAADYIELYCYHNEGGDMSTSASSTFLAMHKLQGL